VQVKKKAGKPAPVTRKPAPVQNKTCTGAGEPLKITTEGTTQVRVAPQLGARGGPKKRRTNGASEKQTDAAAERFPDFWSAYPRQHDRLKAERAFKEALKHATADEIIAGARRYANDATRCRQEREAGSLGYTTFPANWLRDRGWLNAYSNGGVTLDQHGNEIVTSRGPKASWLDTIPDDWDELWRAP
jgi:hypothetical protein